MVLWNALHPLIEASEEGKKKSVPLHSEKTLCPLGLHSHGGEASEGTQSEQQIWVTCLGICEAQVHLRSNWGICWRVKGLILSRLYGVKFELT